MMCCPYFWQLNSARDSACLTFSIMCFFVVPPWTYQCDDKKKVKKKQIVGRYFDFPKRSRPWAWPVKCRKCLLMLGAYYPVISELFFECNTFYDKGHNIRSHLWGPAKVTPIVQRFAVEFPLRESITWVCRNLDSNTWPWACKVNLLNKCTNSAIEIIENNVNIIQYSNVKTDTNSKWRYNILVFHTSVS